jgi:predicted nucleic acid-binding protein
LILVDSSVWIDCFGAPKQRKQIISMASFGHAPLAIGDLILAEVLHGFDSERDFKSAERLLATLMIVEIGGREIATSTREPTIAIQQGGRTLSKIRY